MSRFESSEFLIEKYRKAHTQNPGSKFFAPLAEAHRKAGHYDEAIDLLKKGIKDHPHYASAYVCLAQCYLDLNQLNIAYSLLSPLVNDHAENYKLMSLFAMLSEKLGHLEKALQTYKTLLYLHPKDKTAIEKVKDLEASLKAPVISENSTSNLFDLSSLEDSSWQEIALNSIESLENKEVNKKEITLVSTPKVEVKIDFEEEKQEVETISFETQPVITHTLVDLYLNQGHREKALEIVEKILESNPKDERTLEKKRQILKLLENVHDIKIIEEEKAPVSLMDLYDKKFGDKENVVSTEKKEKLEQFLSKIKEHAIYKSQTHAK